MLSHDTAYSKEQALPPHMAVWMRQGCLPRLQAHMDKVLSCFQAWGAPGIFHDLPWKRTEQSWGQHKARATQVNSGEWEGLANL